MDQGQSQGRVASNASSSSADSSTRHPRTSRHSGHGQRTKDRSSTNSSNSSARSRHVPFDRLSSTGSTLRDTFFGPKRDDILDASSNVEFQMTVIDEGGATEEEYAVITKPEMSCTDWSLAGVIVATLGMTIVGTSFLATMLMERLDGYTIDAGLVIGSLQTLTLCFIVFVTYQGVQPFQAHPNPLILYKCVIDCLIALRFLLDPLWQEWGVYVSGDRASCAWLSGVTQVLFFASESWYFMLIVDLYISLNNPFTSVKANRKWYKLGVYSAALLSGLITAKTSSIHGFADGGYCWTHRGDNLERNFWRLNISTWAMFYSFMILFYLSGNAVLVFGMKRLRSGLKDTLQTRQEMLRNGAISILSYTVYWTFVFFWYAISFQARLLDEQGNHQPTKVFRSFTYTLTGRGAVDFFVWFMINRPSLITKHWLKFSSQSADTKFSAQLNSALQRELIYFTIEGMTKSIEMADREFQQQQNQTPMAQYPRHSASENNTFTDSDILQPASSPGEASMCPDTLESPSEANPHPRGTEITMLPVSRGPNRNTTSTSTTTSAYSNVITFTPFKSEVFAELRSAFGIKSDEFIRSFEQSTKPSISEGASGAFMFFSGDKKYIVKSMAEAECRVLCEMAENYVEHFITHPWSLITKFYGCFRITLYGNRFYFVVMENLFNVMAEGVTIHHRYDIKGSWVNRSYKRPHVGAKVKCRHCSMQFKYGVKNANTKCPNVVGRHEPNVVLKDNDLRTRMRIGADAGRELYEALRDDSLFICEMGIMDYSLLLGVVDVEFVVDQLPPQQSSQRTDKGDAKALANDAEGPVTSAHSLVQNANAPPAVRERHTMRKSERVFGPGYYYVGIIDILQAWNWRKQLERWWKVNVQRCDPEGLSAIEPRRYQQRFERKLREIIAFPKDQDAMMQSTKTPGSELSHAQRKAPTRAPGAMMNPADPRLFPSVQDSEELRDSQVSLCPDDLDDEDFDPLASRNPRQIMMNHRERMVSAGSGRLNITQRSPAMH